MSSHPGSTLKRRGGAGSFLKRERLHPDQVQDFYPTPGTIATCMFYTGLDPYTLREVYVPRTNREKAQQRALLQYYDPKKREQVVQALLAAGRPDLIGSGAHQLVNAVQPSKTVKSQAINRQSSTSGRRNRALVGGENALSAE